MAQRYESQRDGDEGRYRSNGNEEPGGRYDPSRGRDRDQDRGTYDDRNKQTAGRWSEGRGHEGNYLGGEGRRGYSGYGRDDSYGPDSGENYGVGGFDEGVYQGYSTNTGYGQGHYEDVGRRGWSGRQGGEGTWSRERGYGNRWPQQMNRTDGWSGEVGYGFGGASAGGQSYGQRGWSGQGAGQGYGSQGWTGGHYGEGMPGHRGGAENSGDSQRSVDADPSFHRYANEHLSGYDRHYQSWRGEQEKKLRDEYDKYRKEQQAKWSKDFESWRGSQQSSTDDESRKSMSNAKKS